MKTSAQQKRNQVVFIMVLPHQLVFLQYREELNLDPKIGWHNKTDQLVVFHLSGPC